MKTAPNWANRPHSGPGDSGAVNIHKGLAMNVSPPKPERKTHVDLDGDGPGRVHTPGYFSTKR